MPKYKVTSGSIYDPQQPKHQFFCEGQVLELKETAKVKECASYGTLEKLLDSEPEILDPGALQAQATQPEPQVEPEPQPEPQQPKTKK